MNPPGGALGDPTQPMFTPPSLPLLVFTDLDGTLLDHHSYSFEAALPALRRLAEHGVPLIPTTSKTFAEVRELNDRQLANPHPCIVENGAALCLPAGYFADQGAIDPDTGYRTEPLAAGYRQILDVLTRVRETHDLRFRGFSDMSVDEVAADTGLAPEAAARAKQRQGTEPLLWEDTEAALALFRTELDKAGLTLTRGGRYWHVMGDTDKARAMATLCDRYRRAGFTDFTTVALGDSPNDAQMLAAADIAVVVRRPDDSWLDAHGRQQTLTTTAAGPAGWNAAMLDLLDQIQCQGAGHGD